MKKLLKFFFLPVLFMPSLIFSAENPTALFLVESEPDTHLCSMGGIFTSLDFTDTFSNPWVPAKAGNYGLSVSHWAGVVENSNFNYAGASIATKYGLLAFNCLKYDAGQEDVYEADGSHRTVDLEKDTLAGIGYGNKISDVFNAGVNIKYLSSVLADDYSASALLGDIGIMARTYDDIHHFGIAVKNIGQNLKYYKAEENLPEEIAGGYTVKTLIGGDCYVFGAGYARIIGSDIDTYSAGFTLCPGDIKYFTVSGGASYSESVISYSAGIGIIISGLQCDAGYILNPNELSSANSQLRFSLSWKWGKDDNEE